MRSGGQLERIAVTADGASILDRAGGEHALRFADILSIEAYKLDEITTDLVCFDIQLAGDPPLVMFVHEDAEGWDGLLERLEQLPGFDIGWRDRVVQPPFAENRTIVYDRRTD